VDSGAYLDALSRYIHLNPVRAGLVRRVRDYEWSSCRYFVAGGKAPPWLEVNRILAGFARTGTLARRRYAAYLAEADVPNPFDGVVAGTVLGAEPFVRWVKDTFLSVRPNDREIPELAQLKRSVPVEAVVREVVEHLDVKPEQVSARGRKQNRARDLAIYLSRELTGLSCRELGRCFGAVSGAAITMRCKDVIRRMQKDRALLRDAMRVRRRILET
jgi:putative transposase